MSIIETNLDKINELCLRYKVNLTLENLLQRKIDLLESKEIKNPFLKNNIDVTKVLVYRRPN